MRWFHRLAMRMRMLFGRDSQASRLDDELRFHLERQIAENLAAGMSAEEARAAALRAFGNPALLRDQTHATWAWEWLDSLRGDLRFAVRSLWRAQGFAIVAIGTFALGIGSAAAMFTVVDRVLLRAAPYGEPDRLAQIRLGDRTGKDIRGAPWLDIEEWSSRSRSFEQIALAGTMSGRNFLEGASASVQIEGITASANLLDVLKTAPMLGHGFVPEPVSSSAGKNAATVLLSYPAWETAFSGDAAIVGKVARINGAPYTVIGVMPRGFFFPRRFQQLAQVWVPLQLGANERSRDSATSYRVVARLRNGATIESAQAEMSAIQKTIAPEHEDPDSRKLHADAIVTRYADTLVDADVKKALWALLAASGVLWLIAAVNVANLLLARGTARQREIAVRGALGASRRRVMQQLIMEGIVISSTAAVLGVCLAEAGIRVAKSAAPRSLGFDFTAQTDITILAGLCALTLLSVLVSTAWPAAIAVRAPIEPALRQGAPQAGTGRRQHLLRSALVSVEIAMSLTLLVVCGLLLRTIYTLRHVPLGYRTDHIVVANLNIPSFRFKGENIVQSLYMPMLDRVQHLHGVQAAGLMSEVPLGNTFHVALSLLMNGGAVIAEMKTVTPEIQRVFGFRMLAGRFYNDQDKPNSAPVVVVNPAFARLFAPNKHDPSSLIGLQMWSVRKDAPAHIIGVLDNERQKSIAQPSQPEVDFCLCQVTTDTKNYGPATMAMDLALRTDRPTAEIIPELRDILRKASPELGTAQISTMDQIVEDSYGSQRLAAHLLEIFGGSALLLCIAGLYGLLAYAVAQRTRELGVRIALGASRGALVWMVLRQAGVMLLIGVAAGICLALASRKLVSGFLYGVSAHDGWTLAGSALLLLACGMLAAYLPARRAANVDPMEALRAE
jgi:predicted permease